MISSFKNSFLLEREEDVANFVGLRIDQDKDKGSVSLTQTVSIDRILLATGLDNSNLK